MVVYLRDKGPNEAWQLGILGPQLRQGGPEQFGCHPAVVGPCEMSKVVQRHTHTQIAMS